MIIDCILDRYDGQPYNARHFYWDMLNYGGYYGNKISMAMDYLPEEEVKEALKEYVIACEYNPKICDFIDACEWCEDDKEGTFWPDIIPIR